MLTSRLRLGIVFLADAALVALREGTAVLNSSRPLVKLVGLRVSSTFQTEDVFQIGFDVEWVMTIRNPFVIRGSVIDFSKLFGLKLAGFVDDDSSFSLKFSDDTELIVDLDAVRASSSDGIELIGPDNLIFVWR